jgi:hypothetical protein
MNRIQNHLDQVHLIAKLADLKEDHYQTSLLLSAVTQLLIEKGILSAKEIRAKAAELDAAFSLGLAFGNSPNGSSTSSPSPSVNPSPYHPSP